MKSASFPQVNRTLTAPPGCEDSCDPLEVFVNENEVISCWTLDAFELERLHKNGGRIWLRIITNSGSQPPVALQVVEPFERSTQTVP